MAITAQNIASILGVRAATMSELDELVQKGLPKQALERTLQTVYAERSEWKQFQAKVIPIATLKRRKARLSVIESERTERLARVAATAREIWNGDEEAAREWLRTPHKELGGIAPIQAALTELGARRVEKVLMTIFYGLPA